MRKNKPGEFAWIDGIRRQFGPLVPSGMEGIGDDCAVVPVGGGESLVVTTDMLVEDVHFVRDRISPEDLGYKSLAVNLSDIAAMGAVPVASFLSVGLPEGVNADWRERFLAGYKSLSEAFGVPLLGGDTTASGKLVISVTAIGKAPDGQLKRRSGAKPGDIVCVTGNLGDSAAGLLLQGEKPEGEDEKALVAAHHRPKAYVKEGVWLGEQSAVHALMDVSDGIASDLVHILEESGVAAVVDLDRLPVSASLKCVATKKGWDMEKLAVSGGEDYVLLFTVAESGFSDLNQRYYSEFNTQLYPIGRIVSGEAEIGWRRNGLPVERDWKGFEHF